ncbi:MAG: hypothetical protein H0X62_00410 [Bacteroidetes bacterium]|nr:hypothetical protein [Bacteroidota bacterium]
MRRLLLLALLFVCSFANAQMGQTIRGYYLPYAKFNIGADGSYIVNSTAITTRMASQAFSGAFIGNDLKEQVFGNFDELPASLGGDINLGAYFVVSPDSLFKRTGMSWFGAFNHRTHFNSLIPRDAFGLAAFGNARYEGQTADISGLEANLLSYQQLQAGLMFNRGNTGIGLSFIKGHENQRLSVPNASVFTAMDGEYIDLSLVMSARQTDRERRDFHHFNGAGASVDFFTFINFGFLEDLNHRLLIEVKDLGFITWNNRATSYRIDSAYRFDGFAIDNLFTLSDSVFGPNISDSALLANASTSRQSYTTALPAFFHIADVIQVHEELLVMGGLMYRMVANYNIYFYLRGFYRLNPNVEVSARIAWGGYGVLNGGAAVNLRIKQKYHLTLGTENIEGWLLPQYARGSSAFLGLQRRL